MNNTRGLLSRNSLVWLLTAQGFALLPLFWSLPFWLPLMWTAVLLWRVQEFRGRWPMPKPIVKVVLVCTSLSGLWLSFGGFLGLEPMVAMLACAALLKQLEMQQQRDATLLVFLNFFLIGVQLLFSQSIFTAIYVALCVWLAVSAQLSLQQRQGNKNSWRSMRLAGRVLLHALPLMLLMFLVMPRLGALWSVPNPNQSATTGLSDRIAPGDISELSRSSEVAFRVSFEEGADGRQPNQSQLYWRALVLSRFDGRQWLVNRNPQDQLEPPVAWSNQQTAWRRDNNRDSERLSAAQSSLPPSSSSSLPLSPPLQYTVIMEPSQQKWLYSLALVQQWQSSQRSNDIGLTWNQLLIRSEPVYSRFQYSVTSQPSYRYETRLPQWRRNHELRLPKQGNEQARQMAQQWRQQSASDQAYIQALLSFYHQHFTYSLEPPALGRNSVDEFLFQTQKGFCEHFASSFVFMLRAAGIPARVVVGYMGGEYNPQADYWIVRQYDAHAWAEVWLPEQGWQRIDPTAAVAPERIEFSLGQLQSDQVEGLSLLGGGHLRWAASLVNYWDSLNYRWQRTVMGFDQQSQYQLLQRWFGDLSPLKMVLVVFIAGAAILIGMSAHLWWQARPQPLSHSDRLYQRFERIMTRKGWHRRLGETPDQFAQRIVAALQSHASQGKSSKGKSSKEKVSQVKTAPQRAQFCEDVMSFSRFYQQHLYANEDLPKLECEQLLKRLRNTRLR